MFLLIPLRISYMHTLYFDHIPHPLWLTPPRSTLTPWPLPTLCAHLAQSTTPVNSQVWSSPLVNIVDLPGVTPLKKTNSSFLRSHQLSTVLQERIDVFSWSPLPVPCWNVNWYYAGHMQSATADVRILNAVDLSSLEDIVSSPPHLCLWWSFCPLFLSGSLVLRDGHVI